MIQITKQEAEFLRKNGFGKDVHMSSQEHKSRAKRYYATQKDRIINLLNDYREATVVYAVDR